MTALPDWMRPPREEGWSADDLDHLPEAPRRTELIDGGGVVGQEEHRVGDLPQLDDASGPSYDARAELIDIGPDAIPALIGDLLLASEVCFSGSAYCFALARFGTHADAEILTAYLDRYLPRTDLRYDQHAALGALLRLDAHLGTHHADRFTRPDGLWDQWVDALPHLRGHPAYTPVERRRATDLQCDFANGWRRP
ncbi:DUF6000 family protein [Streptomyces sp. M7]|uniref:DUF6000 family protein n=1 Tax=Streptomyces sp. M7 TaxID=255705 RepID=UPI0021628175|nr:DUF6000 family protein [Streptomyces sp. M7]